MEGFYASTLTTFSHTHSVGMHVCTENTEFIHRITPFETHPDSLVPQASASR